ncbi:protein of unknown function [Tistlia consotensis]|uniref:DUF3576 domain-containing protein n=1 Tax=Tistlia consotensis USBA 355 TaxID=560819 RepID=A0A1Y6CS26_9PROT|nr:DUF3576 domain-containing protein [Tistlia consotensis]SMF72349.1 protein of unknown function [Tistlia consotensis USBA 355]SNS08946.1 protein of unknown function [Tistlia consotensis]
MSDRLPSAPPFAPPSSRPSGRTRCLRLAALLLLAGGLAACSDVGGGDTVYPHSKPGKGGGSTYQTQSSLFGKGGLNLFGGSDKAPPGAGTGGGSAVGVNPELWRATLDTLSFMPLASADPFGGEIITDWYSPPESPKERLKVDAFILGKQLRADGIRVRMFRQVLTKDGAWVDAPTDKKSDEALENEILTRARQLYIAQAGGS